MIFNYPFDKKMKKQISVLGKRKLFEEKPTKSLESILVDWQNEAGITKKQKKVRQKAVKRIRECAKKKKSTRLDLSWLGLDSLPIGIFEYLTQLRTFCLNENHLSTLPEQLFEPLTQLEELYLSRNQLSSLPEKLFKGVTQLEHLDLGYNQFKSLPEKLFKGLNQLTVLSLKGNYLSILHENLFKELNQLTVLGLKGNYLSILHENLFKELTQLEEVNLDYNHLESLPENLFKWLTQLRRLDLNNNELRSLPENLFKWLTQLSWLNLENNHLDRLPSEIGQLHQLKHLYLSGNDHIKLPLSILGLNIDFVESKVLYYAIKQAINNNTPENRELIQRLLKNQLLKSMFWIVLKTMKLVMKNYIHTV